MNRPVRSKVAFGAAMFAMLWVAAGTAMAQMPMPGTAPAGAPGAGSDIIRIRKMEPVQGTKTPMFQTSVQGQSSGRRTEWWRVVVEFETAPEWIDELEFTYYAYLKDKSNKGAEVMFRGTVTYVNVVKGKHLSDMFLHPSTVERMGSVEQVAVVVKYRGATVAVENSAKMPNWWERFSPVDGVLLNRSQTPFSVLDFDSFEAIKPAAPAR